MMEISLSEKAYELIKREIITCELSPGEQIAQPQFVERYRIGLTPIRAALQRLAQEGLVQPVPRLGYIVAPITLSDVQEIFELRAILESAAARMAAERGSRKQLTQLAECAGFTYIYHDRESYSLFLAQNEQFHRSVAVIAGNQRLVDSISKMMSELSRVFHLGLDIRDSAQEMLEEHQLLVEALLRRDPGRAEEVVSNQITRSQQRVVEALLSQINSGTSKLLRESIRVRPSGFSSDN